MQYFPMLYDTKGKRVLVIGGSAAAKLKIKNLLSFDAEITVIAKETDIDNKNIHIIKKPFEISDLNGFDIVVSAVNDKELDSVISKHCKENNIPVNIVDDREKSTFIFPAVLTKGDLTVAVSTNGKSPVAAGLIRDKINSVIPDDIELLIDEMYELRQELLEKNITYQERKEILKKYYEEHY